MTKPIRIAINGFGRIGRQFLKAALENKSLDIAAINDLGDIKNLAYLLEFDSVYGRYDKEIATGNNELIVDGKKIKYFKEPNPEKLPWKELNIDVVVESTGFFTSYEKAKAHLDAGAKRVVLSAPAKDENETVTATPNVNIAAMEKSKITSNASCTTNAITPIASIMSKKLAADSKYILIDIPYGKNAKISSREKALRIKRRFERLGRYFKRKVKCFITDGSQPVGNGIGPALELIDIIKILDPKQEGPLDLEKKSLFLAGSLFEMTGKAKNGCGEKMAEEILRSGKAFEKFKEIIKAQNGNLNRLKMAKFSHDIHSIKSGEITEINNYKINSLVRVSGCPVDKSAGIYLYSHVGDKIKKGQKIITIYAESMSRLNEAKRFYEKEKPIVIK